MPPDKVIKDNETKMYWPKTTPIIPNTKGVRKPYKSKEGDHVHITILETYPRE